MAEPSSKDSGTEFWSTLLHQEGAAQGSTTLPPLSRTKSLSGKRQQAAEPQQRLARTVSCPRLRRPAPCGNLPAPSAVRDGSSGSRTLSAKQLPAAPPQRVQRTLSMFSLQRGPTPHVLGGKGSSCNTAAGAANAGPPRRLPTLGSESFSEEEKEGYLMPKQQLTAQQTAPTSEGSLGLLGLEEFQALTPLLQSAEHTVYAATARDGRRVVVKAYVKACVSAGPARRQFLLERRLLGMLRHEHIIQGLGEFEDEAAHYLVQELAEGRSVRQYLGYWLRRRLESPPAAPTPVVPESEIVELVVRPLLSALACLHQQGIVHRDIKLANLVFTRSGCLKLIDFGLALDTQTDLPQPMVGTLHFMAPEVASGQLLDAALADRTDVWGVAVVVFMLLCGRLPIFHESRACFRAMLAECDIPFEALEAVGTSQQAMSFARQALVRDPSLRPTAAQLLEHPWVAVNVPWTGGCHNLNCSPHTRQSGMCRVSKGHDAI